jgi:hypothetical protein
VVVALSVPLVLAIVLVVMNAAGMSLDRISLGALILALGLLVDDAIISVEMMVAKMEEGWHRPESRALNLGPNWGQCCTCESIAEATQRQRYSDPSSHGARVYNTIDIWLQFCRNTAELASNPSPSSLVARYVNQPWTKNPATVAKTTVEVG